MEEVVTNDNDCPRYVPAVLDREMIQVILMIGHDSADCPYTLLVFTLLSEQCKEEHCVSCDILPERVEGIRWLS